MLVWVLLCGWLAGFAEAQLGAGDIAVIAFNTDGGQDTVDEFAWVALRAIPANTTICFTDSSVSNGCFRWTEHLGDAVLPGPLTWSHTNALPAGSAITWAAGEVREWSMGAHSGGWPALSSDGDQLFVYCGTITQREEDVSVWRGIADEATMIFGLNFANGGWDHVTGGGTTTSFVPTGLSTNLRTAVHVDAKDNGYYAGVRTGTVEALLKAISIPAHWTTSSDPFTCDQWPNVFTVLPDNRGTKFCIR
jgi:hypothetical protein